MYIRCLWSDQLEVRPNIAQPSARQDAAKGGLNDLPRRASNIEEEIAPLPSANVSSYNGVPSSQIQPVYKTAYSLRFLRPGTGTIVEITRTSLDESIVAAILEGALRVLPPDNTPDGIVKRKQEMALKAAHATRAESAFVEDLRRLRPMLLDEHEQQQKIRAAIEQGRHDIIKCTPDALFDLPVHFGGFLCHWVEYKNTFGFKQNPFLHRQHKKQLVRYAETFGPGMVVFKLGFESNLFNIAGLCCFREKEARYWVDQAVSAESKANQ